MIGDSDFENSIMKLTRSMITRKSSRGSGKALVIEMVAAACMVAKYIDFQLSIRQDSEDNMSWLTKKKRVHGSRVTGFSYFLVNFISRTWKKGCGEGFNNTFCDLNKSFYNWVIFPKNQFQFQNAKAIPKIDSLCKIALRGFRW